MGRKVEEAMLHFIVSQAKLLGASFIKAEYIPTAKNRPCLEFWRRSGFAEADSVFSFETKEDCLLPEGVSLKFNFHVNEA
jgi:predicted enzyme involved in methoxymalonyl-ACP biosynthesis